MEQVVNDDAPAIVRNSSDQVINDESEVDENGGEEGSASDGGTKKIFPCLFGGCDKVFLHLFLCFFILCETSVKHLLLDFSEEL